MSKSYNIDTLCRVFYMTALREYIGQKIKVYVPWQITAADIEPITAHYKEKWGIRIYKL